MKSESLKSLAKKRQKMKNELEQKLEEIERNINSDDDLNMYNTYKTELDQIFDNIAKGIRVRSKCQWYEEGEKSTKYFLNLEKQRGLQEQIRKIIVNGLEITDSEKIEYELKSFYKKLFENNSLSCLEQDIFLNNVSLPCLNQQQQHLC